MQATTMWQKTTGSGITVALIDSGVQADLPDLVGQVLPGKNFSALPGGADTDVDKDGHGSQMASLIAGTAKNGGGQGAQGLAPGVKILPLRVVGQGDNEAAFTASYSSQLAAAINYAADSNAQVINLSQGQPVDAPAVKAAVAYAESKGKLVVAAVGNDGATGNPVNYPAAYPGVLGVASINEQAQVTQDSEYGPQVAITAPGSNMYDACPGPTGYCESSGTSDATAIVSASAALVWSLHPTWTANQVMRVLINTADGNGKWDPHFGWGVVRPRVALTNPGDPGPADVNPLIPASASTPPSAKPSAPASAKPSSSPVSSSGSSSGGSNTGLYIGIGVAVVVLGGGGAAFALMRRGKKDDRNGPPPPPPGAGPGAGPVGYGGYQPQAQAQPQGPVGYPPQGAPDAQAPNAPYGNLPNPYGNNPRQ
ncbi:type VII secretion-associated serine protease mycosin [Streptacidiphilus fuscans]|uniref:Type VII secretion-associated serine protease mycosin n=1 Tax=Streptacidiphilus fuscans TaxID=2789292 RepID=A0A931BEQ9_9ACTN|nr:type VII secretion-associated serine protease mycosin [Streptacidiphilus fuscans]MBF9073932.1 type VII secretion-associated serine protease mycosin [Streptacidiphilus fuscans]